MNRYQPSRFRFAFGVAAVAAAVVNFGALVVLPAQVDAGDPDAYAIAAVEQEPHVDSGRAATQAREAREQRHRLIAHAVAGGDPDAPVHFAHSRTGIVDGEDKP